MLYGNSIHEIDVHRRACVSVCECVGPHATALIGGVGGMCTLTNYVTHTRTYWKRYGVRSKQLIIEVRSAAKKHAQECWALQRRCACAREEMLACICSYNKAAHNRRTHKV